MLKARCIGKRVGNILLAKGSLGKALAELKKRGADTTALLQEQTTLSLAPPPPPKRKHAAAETSAADDAAVTTTTTVTTSVATNATPKISPLPLPPPTVPVLPVSWCWPTPGIPGRLCE